MKWQPISSAPRDGTAILGYWTPATTGVIGESCYGLARWDEGEFGWVDADDAGNSWSEPTHWMHLPEPPA